ncbi:MAG: hypothetical protein LBE25_08135 [Arthrobacter sp.]|jgi:hypothetical protein|nr:hypothetical protein [Arthrobacter sp.]
MSTQSWREHYSLLTDGVPAEAWHPAAEGEAAWVVLSASAQEVAREGSLPQEGVLSQAPLGDYDVIELSVFAKPCARIRWRYDGEEGGALSEVQAVAGADIDAPTRAALVEAALDELWQEGGEEVFTVVPAEQEEQYTGAGWSVLERVSRG